MRASKTFLLCLLLAAGCAHVKPQPNGTRAFDFNRDTFAFPNELVWDYKDGVRAPSDKPSDAEKRYTHRCFAMSRATLQFWKFARFEPAAPRLDAAELTRRIQLVVGRDPTDPPTPLEKRVVFPGYRDLRGFSKEHVEALRANLGSSMESYLRLGNFFLPFDMPLEHQARTNAELQAWLRANQPMALWLYDFEFPHPRMNHALVAIAQVAADGKCVYRIYDPNHPESPKRMEYDPKTRRFSYEKTNCFAGGLVWVRPCYVSALE